ncbi:MAG: hypothetical protein LBS31_05215 [Candidatus Adiutrix sp.]|jgi:hypothetical protein|nr:hypothetical protein [Candidatus Adiutrix sp.]
MTTTALENNAAAHGPAVPLNELLDAYSQCLTMSRDYAAGCLKREYGDVDVNLLDEFLSARADLFAFAETSLHALEHSRDENEADAETRRLLTEKIISVLEEMTAVESQLADFLDSRLREMRATIDLMQRSQPVFKRYGQLGGKKGPRLIVAQG